MQKGRYSPLKRITKKILVFFQSFSANKATIFLIFGVLFSVGFFITSVNAELTIDISRGKHEPLPIALPDFIGETDEERTMGTELSSIISRNLESSRLFKPIDPKAFIETITSISLTQPKFADWRLINAKHLVTGKVIVGSDERLSVEFRVWDTIGERATQGYRFSATNKQYKTLRQLAHIISDRVYTQLTGEQRGYFESRIVYVAESGPLDRRIKKLMIMDQDSRNFEELTDGKFLALTPRFSPKPDEITYLSFEKGGPRVYLRNLRSGAEEILGQFKGMTFAPRFSPDGNSVVLTYARDGNSELYEMDLITGKTRQLTKNDAIDTAPSYSPDGRYITFESDRGGSQQIYVMKRDGSESRRITFGKGRYGTPVWSPRGDLIAFTKQRRGQFAIGVIKPSGEGERILIRDYLVESPTWAPNGRVLMFMRQSSRDPESSELWTLDIALGMPRLVPTPTAASDPAWSPLLTQ